MNMKRDKALITRDPQWGEYTLQIIDKETGEIKPGTSSQIFGLLHDAYAFAIWHNLEIIKPTLPPGRPY